MRKIQKYIPFLFILIPIISFIIALIFVFHYQNEYQTAENEYQDISVSVNDAITRNIEVINAKAKENSEDVTKQNSPLEQIDFYALKQTNNDIVGWITIPACQINYPIVQGNDNAYYLTHTVKGTNNSAGSIFMDYENTPDFSDAHTLLYGHNMKDNSMFGGLKKIRNNVSLINESPYLYIFTPDGRTKQYKIFAMRTVEPESNAYRLFEGDAYYEEFFNECLSESIAGIKQDGYTIGAPILTLSTCTGDNDRLLVHCILTAIW